jgi:transcriptional regulator with XRE-family HTH domain
MQTADFLVEKVEDGYTAYAQGFSILVMADTLKEVYANATEALVVQCEVTDDKLSDFQIAFRYDFATLFEVYDIVNVKALCKRLGMNNSLISQYISGKKEPSLKQKAKIERGLHEFAKELLQFSFK